MLFVLGCVFCVGNRDSGMFVEYKEALNELGEIEKDGVPPLLVVLCCRVEGK